MIKKATNWKISTKFLNFKRPKNPNFIVPKWIIFSEKILDMGLDAYLYEARKTASKYITIKFNGSSFKVRFSNHKPIKIREKNMDCDFFVGVNNKSIQTTDDALVAVKNWINKNKN